MLFCRSAPRRRRHPRPTPRKKGTHHGSDSGSGWIDRRHAGRPVEGLLHRARWPARHGGAVRGRASRHQRRARLQHAGLSEHHQQRLAHRRARRLRPAADAGRCGHRVRGRGRRLRVELERPAVAIDLQRRRAVRRARAPELGALQVRRPARFAAGRVLRVAEGAAGQSVRHPVRDLLGRRLSARAGRRHHPRQLHAADRGPDPLRQELRARQLPAAGQGVRLPPTWTTRPPANCSTRSSVHWRRPSVPTPTTRPKATASPASSRTPSASPPACRTPSSAATAGRPTAAW